MDEYLHRGRRHVLHLAHLDLALLGSLEDAVDEGRGLGSRSCRLAEGNLRDGQCLAVTLLYLGPDTHGTTPLPVVVFRYVDAATGGEVGIEHEFLAVQVVYGGITDVVEVVGQNLATQSHGNALGSLCQEQRELHGQGHRLLVAAVVTQFPFRGLGVEDHVEGKLRESGLDVTACCGIVAREDVAPVALAIYQQVFLPQLYQGVLDAGIAMRVELHGMPHDVGHLVVAPVIHALHGMQDASLYGFEAVADMRHGTFQDDVAGVVQEPALVHLVQVVGDAFGIQNVVGHIVSSSAQSYELFAS